MDLNQLFLLTVVSILTFVTSMCIFHRRCAGAYTGRFCGGELRAEKMTGNKDDIGGMSSVLGITLGTLAVFLGLVAVMACMFAVFQQRRNSAHIR